MAQIYDGFSASVIYGLESYGFCKEGEALDFIQDGRIELDGELPLNTFGGSLGTGRIHGLWHIIEGALQASGRAGSRQVKDANVSFVGASAPIVTGTTFIFVGEPSMSVGATRANYPPLVRWQQRKIFPTEHGEPQQIREGSELPPRSCCWHRAWPRWQSASTAPRSWPRCLPCGLNSVSALSALSGQ